MPSQRERQYERGMQEGLDLRDQLREQLGDRDQDLKILGKEIDRLKFENAMLRLAFCDEAYIVAVQTLDVKALGKGRRQILTTQAIRMLKVGLGEGWPRSSRHEDASLVRRAREKLAELEAL